MGPKDKAEQSGRRGTSAWRAPKAFLLYISGRSCWRGCEFRASECHESTNPDANDLCHHALERSAGGGGEVVAASTGGVGAAVPGLLVSALRLRALEGF